eukprot:11171378-Lingulodinium_polyedra.AAC.1
MPGRPKAKQPKWKSKGVAQEGHQAEQGQAAWGGGNRWRQTGGHQAESGWGRRDGKSGGGNW